MLKKLLIGAASSMLFAGAANAETLSSGGPPVIILVNDGPDFDGPDAIASSPAPEFSNPGFFGGTIGGTDVSALDSSVAHRFDLSNINPPLFGLFLLTIVLNEPVGGANGAGNDRLLVGFANAGGGVNSALINLGNPQALAAGGNTINLDLGALGFTTSIVQNGFFDILITDDTNVDFFTLRIPTSDAPLPAALPLMASALVGGSLIARRRKAKKA